MIEAGELTLRPWRPEDASFVFHACQDPDIQRWGAVPVPFTARHAVEHVRAQPGPARASFAVVRTETDELVGCTWLIRTDDDGASVGVWVAPEARGRGVAAVALEALIRWTGDRDGAGLVRCVVATANAPARTAVERAGFVLAGPAHDALVYVRAAP